MDQAEELRLRVGKYWRWFSAFALLSVFLVLAVRVCAAQSAATTLMRPSGVAYDAAGNLFVADADRNQILEITLAGLLKVVAGTGVQGFAGDGGLATAAELNAPQGVAIGADGTVYIADTGNQRIRAVQGGQITTIAGGAAGFFGDGGLASAAEFNQPVAVALDSAGALLICDRGNQRVRRVSDGVVTTVAGDGVEGFAGDDGPATAAELNEPSGVAVGLDGRIFIADTANQRIRVVTADGKIATFAGTGAAGFGGNGGPATQALLNRPRGLAIDVGGDLLVADQNNQRLRRVGTNGTIVTLAGSGVQDSAVDGAVATTASLNLPGAAAVSSFGWPLVSDQANHTLRVLLEDGRLYEPGGIASRATLSETTSDAVYGTALANVAVNSSAGTPRGEVQIFDGDAEVGQGTLAQGTAGVSLPTLSAGTHTLRGVYAGDGVHPSATANSTVTIAPAPVVASATSATVSYGAPLPALTGTLTGVLAQDQGNVSAVFSAAVPQLPDAGSYPISAALSGSASGNYALSIDPTSGSLTVVPAASVVTLAPVTNAYAGLPLQLNVQVASTTRGVPTGSVEFLDGGTQVASAVLVNGSATAVYLAPAGGSHALTVSYSGDRDFRANTSASMIANVVAMPDFGVSVTGSSQQTVVAGSTANYGLSIASQSTPFTGVVIMSADGLPAGASASFSPPAVVPGGEAAAVTMTVTTAASSARMERGRAFSGLLVSALLLPLLATRRRRIRLVLVCVMGLFGMLGLSGCGARVAPESVLPVKKFVVTVKATSTNLAGSVVVHSAEVTLGIE
ncbi:MAG TPA: Ig-like domain repeat protein [Acidobacteriaceae bacterium]